MKHSGLDDHRYVVTAPMTFIADNGETDDWQPGEQFTVLERRRDKTTVQRGNRTGWIYSSDLECGSKAMTVKRLHPGNRRGPCSHGGAQVVRGTDILWCPACGAIGRTGGGLVDLTPPMGPPPGSSAFLRPDRGKPHG
jgi:hypothetical protein